MINKGTNMSAMSAQQIGKHHQGFPIIGKTKSMVNFKIIQKKIFTLPSHLIFMFLHISHNITQQGKHKTFIFKLIMSMTDSS